MDPCLKMFLLPLLQYHGGWLEGRMLVILSQRILCKALWKQEPKKRGLFGAWLEESRA